jgi:enhanced entry protein EnhC
MTNFKTWLSVTTLTMSVGSYATSGLQDYQLGQFDKAGQQLMEQAQKSPSSNFALGKMQLYGYGVLKNNLLAIEHIKQAAKQGDWLAQQFMARFELTVNQNPKEAMTWFKNLAEAGDTHARDYVMAAYLYGYGVEKNPDKSRRYAVQAAKSGDPIGQYALARDFLEGRHHSTRKMGVVWLKKSAKQKFPNAQYKLGLLYLNGQNIKKDRAKGIDLIAKAAEQNFTPAMVKLAELATKESRDSVAKAWYEKAAEEGNVSAMVALAKQYQDPKSSNHDLNQAYEWMLKAAKKGSVVAQQALAQMYQEGQGVAVNEKEAAVWKAKAEQSEKEVDKRRAEMNVIHFVSNNSAETFEDTTYYLGGILQQWQNKQFLQENRYNPYPKMTQFKRSDLFSPQFEFVKANDVPLQFYYDYLAQMLTKNHNKEWRLARYSLDGNIEELLKEDMLILEPAEQASMVNTKPVFLNPDPTKEVDYLEQLTLGWERNANLRAAVYRLYNQAILGNSDAQFELGQLYHYGMGVKQDSAQAIVYYQLAALQRDVRAEYNLGILYLEGKTDPVDYEKGLSWMTDAAFKGNAYAQYALANIYRYGYSDKDGLQVIEPDQSRSINMYYLSAANQYGPAQYELANLLVRQHNQGLSTLAKQNREKLVKSLYKGAAAKGVAEAYLPMAYYDAVSENPSDQLRAFKMASKLVDEGDKQAALLLGMLYDRGIGTKQDPSEAINWYEKADPSAVKLFIVGSKMLTGESIDKDETDAENLLKQAAEQGFSYADLNLAILYQKQNKPFMFELQKAVNSENARAGMLLADYYLAQPNDVEKTKDAMTIYQQFAEKGDATAQMKLGYIYDEGLLGEQNRQLASEWYTKSAQQGHPIGQFLLAKLYQQGDIGKYPDYQKAQYWYGKAENKLPQAALARGFVLDTFMNRYKQAVKSYQIAAEAKLPLAYYNLGLAYQIGKDRPIDMEKAVFWYEEAAEQGQPDAIALLARLHWTGQANGGQSKALTLFKQAADLKHKDALYQMGLFAETGVLTDVDMNQAVNYYRQAAKQGNDKASLALARIYQYGLTGQADMDKARSIYEQLAKNNNAFAQYQLAMLDMSGHPSEEQAKSAQKWLKLSQENGYNYADKMLYLLDGFYLQNSSYVHPVIINNTVLNDKTSAGELYMDALNKWHQGEGLESTMILEKLIQQHPRYTPARKAYDQISKLDQNVKG